MPAIQGSNPTVADSLATIVSAETTIGRPSPTTRRAYALGQLDVWLDGLRLDDAALAACLAELHDAGRAASSASMAVAAARFNARLAGEPDPAGAATERVLAGLRRRSAANLAAIFATADRPRRAASNPPPGPKRAGRSTASSPGCSSSAGCAARKRRRWPARGSRGREYELFKPSRGGTKRVDGIGTMGRNRGRHTVAESASRLPRRHPLSRSDRATYRSP